MATVLNTFTSSGRRDDNWNSHHRSEAPLKRADRNFAELLQELRVLFTGVQILLGFLLTLAFSPVFPGLDGFRHAVYVVTLLAAASSSGLLIAPVAVHRLLFQGGHKQAIIRASHAAALLALSGLGLTLSSGLLLVLDIALGRAAAVSITAVFVLGIGLLWWAFPYWLRRQTMGLTVVARETRETAQACGDRADCDRTIRSGSLDMPPIRAICSTPC